MSPTRRSFVGTAAGIAAATALGPSILSAAGRIPILGNPHGVLPGADPYVDDLAMEALNAARDAGASYCDVRIGRYRRCSSSQQTQPDLYLRRGGGCR